MTYPHLTTDQVVKAYEFGIFNASAGIGSALRYHWQFGKHRIIFDGVVVFDKVGPSYLDAAIAAYNKHVDLINERERIRAPITIGNVLESGAAPAPIKPTVKKDFAQNKVHIPANADTVVVKDPDTRVVDRRNLASLPRTGFRLARAGR